MITLRPYQTDIESQIYQKWNELSTSRKGNKKSLLVQSPTGSGKCLGKDTPVIMYDGSVKMVQDVITGDLLMGDNSEPRNVLSTCVGTDILYKIIPVRGDSFICNGSHILSLACNADTSIYKRGDIVDVSVEDYFKWSSTQKWCSKLYMTGVEFSIKETVLDPWLIGLWLAEGTKKGGSPNFTINSDDKEILDELNKYNPKITPDYRGHNCCDVALTVIGAAKNPYREEFRTCIYNRDSHDIGIPNSYKINSSDNRLQLLAGLLDGDGYLHKNGFEITTKFDRLSEDILFLSRSLGFRATHTIKIVMGNSYHRINITGNTDIIPMKLSRKKAGIRLQIKDHKRSGFKIEEIGLGNYYGFAIDGNRRFLLGDFTVTHNTRIFSDIAFKAERKGSTVLILTHREELLSQTGGSLIEIGLFPDLVTRDTKFPPKSKLVVGMIETVIRRLKQAMWAEWFKTVDLVINDECHEQLFNRIFDHEETKNKFVLGFTATPERNGKQRQLSDDYEDMIIGLDVQQLINLGYLVKDKYFSVPVDMKGVSIKQGEFDSQEMFGRYNKTELYTGVIDNWKRLCPNTITLVFCCNIQHSINTCKAFNDAGIKAKFIVSDVAKPKELDDKATKGDIAKYNIKKLEYENYIANFDALSGKRKDVIKEWKDGEFYVLINAGIATTGFDHPPIETVILNRATMSSNLLYQMMGRGSRPYKDKKFFYLIDFGDNCRRLTAYYRLCHEWSLTHEESKSDGCGVGAVKDCPACGRLVHASVRICPCGYVFPVTHEQKIVELTEISYSEAVKKLESIKDYEIFAEAKGYSKNWLFRQVFIKFGKDGLIEYAKTHNYPQNWVYIQIARFNAQGLRK